ncbi:unnamed protein product [Alopecurus aequalis]
MSAGESSWAMHFAEFMASSDTKQEMGREGGGASESSFSSGFSSSFDSLGDDDYDEDDSFTNSDLMDEDDEDDSLQDTACSSAAGPKVTSIYDIYMKSIATMDIKEMNTTQLVCLRTIAITSFFRQTLFRCLSYDGVFLKYCRPSISSMRVHGTRRLQVWHKKRPAAEIATTSSCMSVLI